MPVCRMARTLQRATAHDQNASESSGAAIRHTGNFHIRCQDVARAHQCACLVLRLCWGCSRCSTSLRSR